MKTLHLLAVATFIKEVIIIATLVSIPIALIAGIWLIAYTQTV